jgi:hypothetical protein
MLENASISDDLNSPEYFAPLKVILPEELQRFYAERGYLATLPQEERTNARLNVRCQGHIRFFPTMPSLICDIIASDTGQGTMLVKDISRAGIAILYHRQIFPYERFEIFLHGRMIDATAVRCRRIGPKCYETGAIINSIDREEENESTTEVQAVFAAEPTIRPCVTR